MYCVGLTWVSFHSTQPTRLDDFGYQSLVFLGVYVHQGLLFSCRVYFVSSTDYHPYVWLVLGLALLNLLYLVFNPPHLSVNRVGDNNIVLHPHSNSLPLDWC